MTWRGDGRSRPRFGFDDWGLALLSGTVRCVTVVLSNDSKTSCTVRCTYPKGQGMVEYRRLNDLSYSNQTRINAGLGAGCIKG